MITAIVQGLELGQIQGQRGAQKGSRLDGLFHKGEIFTLRPQPDGKVRPSRLHDLADQRADRIYLTHLAEHL